MYNRLGLNEKRLGTLLNWMAPWIRFRAACAVRTALQFPSSQLSV